MPRVALLEDAALREVEAQAAAWEPSLMTRAGSAIAQWAGRLAAGRPGPVVVVVGPGNNGGDGRIAATLLGADRDVVVIDAKTPSWPDIRPALVIDALLGIGISRDVDGAFGSLIASINASAAPVLAVDVPSGLDAATGRVRGRCVRATHTLTFIAGKPGLYTLDGPDHAGEVRIDDLGTGALVHARARGFLLQPASVREMLPARKRNTHKGTFGTLGILGGSPGMTGAALLAGRAALFAGAGKVRVGLLDERLSLDPLHPELMISAPERVLQDDALVVGPGGGASEGFLRLLARALDGHHPLVLDADGLNALAKDRALLTRLASRSAPTILTPHPTEAARLLGIETAAVQADRVAAATSLATRCNACVVLKGAGSICAAPDGRWSINTTGNAGLASGGTGDVLAGVIGALLAQGLAPFDALELGVCAHGAAADALVDRGVGPVGLTAGEVAAEIRYVLNDWSGA